MSVPRNVPPAAGAMLESLRGLGYTTATAIADLIDNSISANATRVDIHFAWNGADSWIRVADNGKGMSDAELEAASLMAIAPIVVFGWFSQKQLVQGLTFGAVK